MREDVVIFVSSKPGVVARKYAFKVVMRSGKMTKELWVSNRVTPGKVVKDKRRSSIISQAANKVILYSYDQTWRFV